MSFDVCKWWYALKAMECVFSDVTNEVIKNSSNNSFQPMFFSNCDWGHTRNLIEIKIYN